MKEYTFDVELMSKDEFIYRLLDDQPMADYEYWDDLLLNFMNQYWTQYQLMRKPFGDRLDYIKQEQWFTISFREEKEVSE